jgi:menaquinol-cytochrome c reductase iron-sulfur subunit
MPSGQWGYCAVPDRRMQTRPRALFFDAMHEGQRPTSKPTRAPRKTFDAGRRRLLVWVPGAVFAGIAGALAATAFRFLRPPARAAAGEAGGSWRTVGELSSLTAGEPLPLRVGVERVDGWAAAREERPVYVLTRAGHKVLSAVCPHEQCEVVWSGETNEFLCPCHDSRFGPEGAKLDGPAERGLDELPTRVEGGVLQVRLDA